MHEPGELGGGEATKQTIVLPVRPGQSEAWRRFIQELQESRCKDFDAACRRWGIRSLAIWLAPGRPADLVVAQLEVAESLEDTDERFMSSQEPFDQWLKERAHEIHGVDLSNRIPIFRAEPMGVWS
jgi:hypothetical protein